MASSSSTAKPIIGILSIGDMGMGIAKLLIAHEYPVLTVSAGRSQHTIDRIKAAKITDVASDEALLAQADIILSIVPPRDAIATARRIADACKSAAGPRKDKKGPDSSDVVYIDLNAVSPRTISKIDAFFASMASDPPPPSTPSLVRQLSRSLSFAGQQQQQRKGSNGGTPPPPITIKFLDGGIIGPPPSRKTEKDSGNSTGNGSGKDKDKGPNRPTLIDAPSNSSSPHTSPWTLPSIPLSGPHEPLLPQALLTALNAKFISPKIGTASALKSCFASLTKGLTALSILSYTTAHTCGVLPELQAHLQTYAPAIAAVTAKSVTGMSPKAYRWIDEMREIGTTFKSSGGLGMGQDVMEGVGEVYRFVSEETVLGGERVGKRKRGMTVEDVAEAVGEGVQKKMRKREGGDEKLELAWRGSWGL